MVLLPGWPSSLICLHNSAFIFFTTSDRKISTTRAAPVPQQPADQQLILSIMPHSNREDEDLQIRVAAGQSVSIKSHAARNFSSVAEGLVTAAEVWDVSGLLNSLDRSTK